MMTKPDPEPEPEPEPGALSTSCTCTAPFLEDQLWVNIATRLDDVLALGRLACAARRFKLIVEQAAGLALAQYPKWVREWVPPLLVETGGGPSCCASKLHILHEANTLLQPLLFSDRCGPGVQLDCHGSVATSSGVFQPAVSAIQMRAGIHAADFLLVSTASDVDTSAGNDIGSWIGVVSADFDAAAGVPAMNSRGDSNMLYTLSSPQLFGTASQGDVVGLQMDFGIGRLSVQLNGVACGALVESGLRGPLRWACDVGYGGAVRIGARQMQQLSLPTPHPHVAGLPEGVVPPDRLSGLRQ